jgi:hypothetical protein
MAHFVPNRCHTPSRSRDRDRGLPLFDRVAKLPRQEHALGDDLRLSRIRVLEHGLCRGLHTCDNVTTTDFGNERNSIWPAKWGTSLRPSFDSLTLLQR